MVICSRKDRHKVNIHTAWAILMPKVICRLRTDFSFEVLKASSKVGNMPSQVDHDQEAELIAQIAMQCDGIGPGKGYSIAEDFAGDFQGFLAAGAGRLLLIKKSNGNSILTQQQAEALSI